MAKPHAVLGLELDATWEEIRARYKSLAQRHHPDRPTGNAEEFRRVRAAFEILEAKRAATGPYDDLFSEVARQVRR